MLSTVQNNLIEKIAKEKGFKNFTTSIEKISKKGDNYLGNIFLVTLRENDGAKEDSLILKCALKNEKVREQMPIGSTYKREVYLYNTVLPALRELQEKHPLPHPFKSFAKLYGFSLDEGDEWLLMENITTQGFRMFNRKLTMDDQHVSTVFRELGKLHSLSFVMKHFEPKKYQQLKANLKDVFEDYTELLDSWIESVKSKLDSVYKYIEGNERATEALKKCEREMKSSFEDIRREKYNLVIIHGDSWCNNMMFKYGDSDNPAKPTDLCFLDWQLSKVTTPVTDLCYFMFLSASKEVLDNHKTYLQQYYQVLEENLNAVQLKLASIFPYEVFEDHWRKFGTIGLFIAISMIDTLLKDEKDASSFSDMADSNQNLFKAFMEQGTQKEETYGRLENIILMLVENKYM